MSPEQLRAELAKLMRKHPDADTISLMVVAYGQGVEDAAQKVDERNTKRLEQFEWAGMGKTRDEELEILSAEIRTLKGEEA